jgi:ascorbate-specific PTS system EIIC-type component UlaA
MFLTIQPTNFVTFCVVMLLCLQLSIGKGDKKQENKKLGRLLSHLKHTCYYSMLFCHFLFIFIFFVFAFHDQNLELAFDEK